MPSRTCTVTSCPKQKEAYYPDLATYFFFLLLSPLDEGHKRKSSPNKKMPLTICEDISSQGQLCHRYTVGSRQERG